MSFSHAVAMPFKDVSASFGFVPSEPQNSVEGPISIAGGGVILRDIASCDSGSDSCALDNFELVPGVSRSEILIESGEGCTARYSTESWILKAAIDLVLDEKKKIYRNIDLLGEARDEELESIEEYGESEKKHFFVEMSPSLVGTRMGENLLTIDLLLTDIIFYAPYDDGAALYTENNPFIPDSLDYESARELFDYFKEIVHLYFVRSEATNWTWHDEFANTTYRIDCENENILLQGSPEFTFLRKDSESNLQSSFDGAEQLNNLMNFATRTLIEKRYQEAVEFSQLCAFLRSIKRSSYLKWNYGTVKIQYGSFQWHSSYKHKLKNMVAELMSKSGETPRILEQ